MRHAKIGKAGDGRPMHFTVGALIEMKRKHLLMDTITLCILLILDLDHELLLPEQKISEKFIYILGVSCSIELIRGGF